MRKYLTIAAALALLPTLALAAPDFTGTWERNGAQSDTVPGSMYWLTRGVEAGGVRGPQSQVTIEVKQTAATLQVADPQDPLRTYTLDGKPYTVPTDTGVEKAVVTATLRDTALTIATTQPWGGMPGNAPLNITRTWTLSADGKVLTVNTVRDTPAKRETYKEVYTKK